VGFEGTSVLEIFSTMKATVLTLCSVVALGAAPHAHAAGLFGTSLFGKSAETTTELKPIGPTLELDSFESAAKQGGEIEQVQFMEPAYVSPQPRSASGVRPGTGAFGGDNVWAGTISFNQDTFFGFYPVIQGAYALNDRWDVTVYSIIWTTDLLSVGTLSTPDGVYNQFGPWTEFGAGLNYKALDGALNINPQLGILNGGLLSQPAAARVFDGFVPNIIAAYESDYIESEFYMGYYFGARGAGAASGFFNNDFLHWWYNAGYRPWTDRGGFLATQSYGVHYEMLRQTGEAAASAANLYSWLGPYWQTRFDNGLVMRYSAGWNINEWGNPVNEAGAFPNFYKVNIAYDF
jgi:hypothetical protein